MAYKDPDKQREANRSRQRRYRAERGKRAYPKGVTGCDIKGVTSQGVTEQGSTRTAELKESKAVAGSSVAEPRTDGTKQPRTATPDKPEGMTPNLGQAGTPDLGQAGTSRKGIAIEGITQIPKEQMCITGDWQAAIDTKPKRGKDIKTFADLSPSVQQTINTLSDDKAEHKRRTAIAINYQHLFPGRFHSVGVAGRSPI